MSDSSAMSAFDEMAARRVTIEERISDLEARLNTEHAERVAADGHAQHATEEAVALLRGAGESLDCLDAVKEAVRVLQAQVSALELAREPTQLSEAERLRRAGWGG